MSLDADRIRGALLGCLLGDAFGRPLEGMAASDPRLDGLIERRRSGRDPLGYSDDSEMMIFVAESLLECGRVDPAHLLEHMARHFEPARGYGKGTRAAFTAADRGATVDGAARSFWPEGSRGNGAAVRVAPLACIYHGDALREAAAASALVTHVHPDAVDAAVIMARAVSAALRAPRGVIPHFDAGPKVETLVRDHASPKQGAEILGNGVLAKESVPLALFCFLRWGDDFETTIVETAHCGGDIDSIAAMSGALSGALVGESAFPRDWLARAEGRARVRDLADRIASGFF